MKKIAIVGASHFVNRMFEACGNYQWAREFLKNSLEADAKKIEFGIEWQAVEKLGVYRRTIIDNGSGMSRDELLKFFSTLGEGAKRIGGVHDNFGVGAKIASLPWNPEGVVVISYKDGKPSMIQIELDPDSADYQLLEFQSEKGTTYVINPAEVEWGSDINWGTVAPEWARQNGTTIVLLGTEETRDTILGNPKVGENAIKGLSVYLNSRFWDLTHVEVTCVELRNERKTSWPTGPADRDDARRPNNRRINGAKHYVADITAKDSKLAATGVVPLDQNRVNAHWYLWEGERPAVHSYARKPGYIGIKYKDELFELTSHRAHFRYFGVTDQKVQQNLFFVLEPQLFDPQVGMWGVHPDQSRNRLIFSGNGEKGAAIPLADWGNEFAECMPEEIREAILKARGEGPNTLTDDEYRKRLQDKFGSRWISTQLVQPKKADDHALDATPGSEEVGVLERNPNPNPNRNPQRRKRKRRIQVIHLRAAAGGNGQGVEREVAVDVPRFTYVGHEQFDSAWHLASWVPTDPLGPTVLMNRDSPILLEAIKHHQELYPDAFSDEVADIVRTTYGEVAVCKIAHSQKLTKYVNEQDLDERYRSDEALTVSLMGLLAEESLIAQRLGRLGRKKTAA
ncbi:MAG: ATP-binding protein [Xanthobacteraceae bacterium]